MRDALGFAGTMETRAGQRSAAKQGCTDGLSHLSSTQTQPGVSSEGPAAPTSCLPAHRLPRHHCWLQARRLRCPQRCLVSLKDPPRVCSAAG